MLGIFITILFTAIAFYAAWTYSIGSKNALKKTDNNAMYIIIAAAGAFVLRVILAAVTKGHETDMNCFIGWSGAIFENGIAKFYTLDMFHDYPPGYMYVLYAVGALQKLFGLTGGASYVLVKLPAIICDIIAGIVIYKIARRKFSDQVSVVFALMYFFNPATILNCSLWGQVDSVYTLFALLMIYFITEKKMIFSYFMFAICIFIKPQAFIFTPVLIGGIIENVFRNDFSKEKFIKNLAFGLGAIALMIIVALPFGIGNVIGQYKATLESYPHATVNAFNIWGAMGMNWGELNPFINILGYVFIASIAVYAVVIILKSKNEGKYYFSGALLAFLTYMLSTKMHDRYAFPAMVLMLAALVMQTDVRSFIAYALVTLSQFFNTAWVLYIYETDTGKYFKSPVIVIASIINIAIAAFVVYNSYKTFILDAPAEKIVQKASNNKKSAPKSSGKAIKNRITSSTIFTRLTRIDLIAMAALTVVYSFVALANLGDMTAPQTEYALENGAVTIDLGEDKYVDTLNYYLGSYNLDETRKLKIEARSGSGAQVFSKEESSGSVFYWNDVSVAKTARYITLSSSGDHLTIEEVALLDKENNIISPVSVTPDKSSALFDEQNKYESADFTNSTYFDEIYHARTAYEFVHHLSVYEWTHPPLGKAIIAIGIMLFGMCPFGWRIAGTVFGIIMVPIIYLFAKRLLKKSWLSIITCILLTFDFMHFAQTRIATIDVYVTFFIMLMYYFMYKYYSTSFYDTDFKKGLTMLLLCGISTGLAIASKMTGVYAALGLAVIFCIIMYRRYSEYRYAVQNPNGETNGISHKLIIDSFKPNIIKTVLWCLLFFVAIPIVIYCLSYIPFLMAPDENGIKSIIDNQSAMLTYHSKTVLGSTHPFSSRWYEWIIMKRPIWYYANTVSDNLKQGISSFGNPLVWWIGIPAFFLMAYRAIRYRDRNSLFLIIAYLAQLVPWMGVERLTFIYHYFPCVPFIVLMIGYSIKCIYDEAKNKKIVMYGAFGYAGLVIVMFVMFYPVLSGMSINPDYVNHFLKWFDSWVLI